MTNRHDNNRGKAAVKAGLQTQEMPLVQLAHGGGRVVCLAALTGPNKGEVIEVVDTVIIGRDPRATFKSSDPGISRQHAQVSITADRLVCVLDLGSSNGTFVRGRTISAEVLGEGDQFTVGESTFLIFSTSEGLEDIQLLPEGIDNIRDQLTGLYNRRFFLERLQREVDIARRRRLPLCVALFELERFAELQRAHGKSVADECLVAAARRLTANIRTEDVGARYDRHRLAVQLTYIQASTCKRIVSRVIDSTATSCPVRGAPELALTLAAGMVDLRREDRTSAQLMHRVEASLQRRCAAPREMGVHGPWQRTTM